jgi:hypothetical protein
MTPKEKANELVVKYLRIENTNEWWSKVPAKQCALIAIDEILELTKKPTYNPFNWNEITGSYYDKYWLEVKQEIEKL